MSEVRLAALTLGLGSMCAGAQPCEPRWSRDYPSGGLGPDVRALAVFPVDGTPRVFAGGNTSYKPPVKQPGANLGWWDGLMWNPVGGVVPDGPVNAMLVWDDGTGDALYAAGEFREIGEEPVRYIARWDGEAWSYMDTGLNNYPLKTSVRALAVYDDGSGPALYAGGRFSRSGDLSRELSNLARWDGQHWNEVGGGVAYSKGTDNSGVYALAVFDDGAGPGLYIGGKFDRAGGQLIEGLARWDGEAWSAVGDPPLAENEAACVNEECIFVHALAAFDDGNGPALYAGGHLRAPGVEAPNLARFRGGVWQPAGRLFDHLKYSRGFLIDSFSVQDTGGNSELYACGRFMTNEPGPEEKTGGCLARWDAGSASWIDLDANPEVKSLTVFDQGSGPQLWVGGTFAGAGDHTPGRASIVGIRTEEGWDNLRTHGVNEFAILTGFDDGSGPALYLAGSSSGWGDISDSTSPGIVRLSDSGWSEVGTWADIDPRIDCGGVDGILDVADAGDGPKLYAFVNLGDSTNDKDHHIFYGIAAWDGQHWSKVGQDLSKFSPPGGFSPSTTVRGGNSTLRWARSGPRSTACKTTSGSSGPRARGPVSASAAPTRPPSWTTARARPFGSAATLARSKG